MAENRSDVFVIVVCIALFLVTGALTGCGGGEPHAGTTPINTNGSSTTVSSTTDSSSTQSTESVDSESSESAGSGTNDTSTEQDGDTQSSAATTDIEKLEIGRSEYQLQCASCHGSSGEGSVLGPVLTTEGWTLSTLATRITQTMPTEDVSTCISDCAENTARFILNGFIVQEEVVEEEVEEEQDDTNPPSEETPENDTPQEESEGEAEEEACNIDLQYFETNIWNPILTDCISCHHSRGPANATLFLLTADTEEGFLESNFTAMQTFAAINSPGRNGSELLLSKPRGIGHGGGQRLSMTTESEDYLSLVEMLERFVNPTPCTTGDEVSDTTDETPQLDLANFMAGVNTGSNLNILRRASLLFGARVPTADERTSVEEGDIDTLKSIIRRTMVGDAFTDFIMNGANDQLLTSKFLNDTTPAFELLDESGYPDAFRRIEETYEQAYNSILLTNGGNVEDAEQRAGEIRDDAWYRTSQAIGQQPLRTILYFVNREESYTNILTTNKIMVNHWSNSAFSSNALFFSINDDTDWRAGDNFGYRVQPFPNAGILTTPTFMARYPSTATNRNRARARWAYKFFLGVDIEALAQRPIDPVALADTDNPTMNNPNCSVCHQVLDPVAGTFQNFGDNGFYLEFDTDSLPETYKLSETYQPGDRWYRDMRSPGFNSREMPDDRDDNALQWLTDQIVGDDRFASGTVKFWWPAVFGEAPLERPLDTTASDYDQQLYMYEAQDAEIERLAELFRTGTAGQAQRGAFNLKDLLLEMVLSPWFSSNSIESESLNADRETTLAKVGGDRLLTPEELHNKFESVTGLSWSAPWEVQWNYLLNEYRTFYGGIDSDGVIERNREINSMMSKVVDRMTTEMTCEIVSKDFQRPTEERILFPYTEIEDIPAGAGETKILQNIQHLHSRLLGESLSLTNTEIVTTYMLFNEIRDLRISQDRPTWLVNENEHCNLDWEDEDRVELDPNHTLRAWMAVLNYLLSDYRFLYQ